MTLRELGIRAARLFRKAVKRARKVYRRVLAEVRADRSNHEVFFRSPMPCRCGGCGQMRRRFVRDMPHNKEGVMLLICRSCARDAYFRKMRQA